MIFMSILIMGMASIIIQTISPYINFFSNCYDVVIILLIYSGLFRPFKEAIVTAFFFGFLMDNISGGPFGFYIISYLWILCYTLFISNYIFKESNLILIILSVISVILQNIIIMFSVISAGSSLYYKEALKIIIKESILSAVSIPLFIIMIKNFFIKFNFEKR